VQKIKADNNVSLLSKLDTSDLKISENTNDWITKNYAVNESNLKCKNQKIAKLLNSKLGCEIISISYHGRTSSYHIGEFVNELEELEVMIKEGREKEVEQRKLDEIQWIEDQEERMENKEPNPLDFGVNMD
jgi:hypothetical protein